MPKAFAAHTGQALAGIEDQPVIDNLFISDGSQFTTGAAENPTLTIVTLAIRQADYIAKQMSSKSI